MIDDNTGMSRPTHFNVCSNIYSKTYYKMAEVLFVTFLASFFLLCTNQMINLNSIRILYGVFPQLHLKASTQS